MPGKTFVDTFFVIALINRRDAYHAQALNLAERFDGLPLVITDSVLLEIGNALARGFKAQAVETIDHFLNSPEVETIRLTPQLFDQAYGLYKVHQDKEWGLIDCISFTVMRQMDIPEALTLDQHYLQAGFRPLMQR